jgi:SPP1 Gp6-like portal protein
MVQTTTQIGDVSLYLLKQITPINDNWVAEQERKAKRIHIFRQYAQGDHLANMTPEMRELMRLGGELDEFNDNYCDVVISTELDRINLTGISTDNDAGDQWVELVQKNSEFDALQDNVHEATLRDGETFLLADPEDMANETLDPETRPETAVFKHELAYDGYEGVVAHYTSSLASKPTFVAKIWREINEDELLQTRFNIYWPDKIRKFAIIQGGEGASGNGITELPGSPFAWVDPKTGKGLGIPFFHFINRSRIKSRPVSELRSVKPLQDALNRTLYSMVMTGELTAFQIKVAIGFKPPAKVTPGMWLVVSEEPLGPDEKADVKTLDQGDVTQYIAQATWITNEIGRVSRTPAPEFMAGPDASGEALKQRESGLIGKVKRFCVRNGGIWEQAFAFANKLQQVFGFKQPPAITDYTADWADPEIRNDDTFLKNLVLIKGDIGRKRFLEEIAELFDWTEQDIEQILKEVDAEQEKMRQNMIQDKAAMLTMGAPGFKGGPVTGNSGGANSQTSNKGQGQ